jgi:hypothetical protein
MLNMILRNPNPTDVVFDTGVVSYDRIPLVREILLGCSPIVLPPVLAEFQDLKRKPELSDLRDLVFPEGAVNPNFRGDQRGVLAAYPRFVTRYASLLTWRKQAIDVPMRRAHRETGQAPVGRVRAKLIQKLIDSGVAAETIKLANKEHRTGRVADEVLAVFSVLSPIATGRDCVLLTADGDVIDQAHRMAQMLFDDYGAYLLASDFQNEESRYPDRHTVKSDFFSGEAIAIGRAAEPYDLLPPTNLTRTCATIVIDVGKLRGFVWISATNMEPAIAFQERDPLGRKGDPGNGNSILFSLPEMRGSERFRCGQTHHFAIGQPTLLRVSGEDIGPVPLSDLFRAHGARRPPPERRPRILSPFLAHRQSLEARVDAAMKRRGR